ncbi:glycoside hydrolase family 6 protein [Natronosporangium hydrolyticum]|uniref:Glucanase n=1 Tax=Natronosporangium hydrolyticum TaxID=2811111 RepID=A0A895Y893_9ACTN|nr:glycoside hydrolase family 6 protein [Natronosporangium hydrolyticum]QSB13571.1 glycoside hydrolase family 6 protein [Natronosporangium hydrolyticum]
MRLGTSRSGRRGIVAVAAAGALVAAALVVPSPAQAAVVCNVSYQANTWNEGPSAGGFTAAITITNIEDPVSGWTLQFTLPAGQTRTDSWSANWSGTSGTVTATNLSWNGSLGTGTATTIGFNGRWTGSYSSPTAFTLNGVTCNAGSGGPGPSPTPTATPTASPSPTPSPTSPPPGQRVDNPYAGADVYVNPIWRANAMAEPGGSRIANQPTGVWLDRTSAIYGNNSPTTGDMGLADHLDEAVRQDQANGAQPLVFQVVIYNLPGRDCSALASNGELGPEEIGRYRTEYIDVIAEILARPAYQNLRIVTIIEIDSLPNLVTNVDGAAGTDMCRTVQQNGAYVNGVGYALATLGAVPNVYNYVDAAHHGWIGWDDNFGPTAQLLFQAANASGASPSDVHGFITNTANYSALTEPYIEVNDTTRPSSWIDWNRYNDELTFAQAFRQRLVQAGFPSGVGMLIDTSRNGWGGPDRPSQASSASDLNTRIDQSRIDRRIHKGNWCNQAGAGLGERPTSAPAAGIDAYVWIKPPGESDGSSRLIPNDEGKGFDGMCDPTYGGNARNGNSPSGALDNAPVSGHWFSEQFQELMRNAYPPL